MSADAESRPDERWVPLVLAVAVLFVWSQTLRLGFASDDIDLVLKNKLTGSWSDASQFFTTDLWTSAGKVDGTGYWRPLFGLSLALDRSLWGQAAWGHHLQSILWHSLGVVGLWRWVRNMCGSVPALIAALAYAFHPIQTEGIAFISARNDVLAAAGLAWTGALWSRPGWRRSICGGLLLLSACLSKESAVLAALVLPLFGADRPVRIGVAVMAVAAWAALRFSLGPPLPATGSVMAAIAMVLPLMAHFVLKLAWPWPLSDSYSLVYNAPGPAQIALAVALATLCSVLCIRRGGRRAVLGLAMAMLCALPATLAVAAYHLMADRYATLPLLGLTVALAAALPDRRLCAAPLLLLLPIWIALDSLRIPDWDSSLSLAQSAASLTPSPYSAGWLGEELRKAGRPSEALPWYLLALKGNPPFCMFAGQTLSVAMAAGHGIAAGQAIQDAGCQGVPDFRARWAAACLIEGQPDGADRIMSPRPDTCDRASGPVLAALAVLDHEPLDMAACAAEAGVPLQTLQASADRLVQFAQ